ncbi:MAG: hypothetical protein ACLFRT_13035 [Actinomycetota bacterium]
MDSSRWEAAGTLDEAKDGLTRREALRRGTLAGIGLVWATPQVVSYRMSAQLAQATSPVAGTTVPGATTTEPSEKTSEPEEPKEPTGSTEPEIEDEVSPTTISKEPTEETVDKGPSAEATQPPAERDSSEEIKDEVLSSELPFTGLPLEQLLPLAGGAVATGAAAVRLARERSGKATVDDEASVE